MCVWNESFCLTIPMACINMLFYQMTEAVRPRSSTDRGGEAGGEAGSRQACNNVIMRVKLSQEHTNRKKILLWLCWLPYLLIKALHDLKLRSEVYQLPGRPLMTAFMSSPMSKSNLSPWLQLFTSDLSLFSNGPSYLEKRNVQYSIFEADNLCSEADKWK